MAINIQNLIDAINTKVQALDRSSDITEINKLTRLTNNINSSGGVLEYRSLGELPDADSGNIGKLVYTQDKKYDDHGTFYFGVADGWQKITLTADSDEGDYTIAASIPFGGTVAGYTSGGDPTTNNVINRFPFTTDANATGNGQLTVVRYFVTGHSSTTDAYVTGGLGAPGTGYNIIEKFPFAAAVPNATDVGDLVGGAIADHAGNSDKAGGYGFTSGGVNPPSWTPLNRIEQFSFISNGNSVDFGDLFRVRQQNTGQSSSTHGYCSGRGPTTVEFEKFPFVSNVVATVVGTLTTTRAAPSGQSSTTYGYNSGGLLVPNNAGSNIIDKFTFASDANATFVGNLTVARGNSTGQSSTTYGYNTGGYQNIIEKFSFTSDGNSTDVGDLSAARGLMGGHEY